MGVLAVFVFDLADGVGDAFEGFFLRGLEGGGVERVGGADGSLPEPGAVGAQLEVGGEAREGGLEAF